MNEVRYFQWLVGEKRGQIIVFDHVEEDDGAIYISFKDGSRVNEELVGQINQTDMTGKLMAEIDSPANMWRFEEKVVGDDSARVEKDWETQVAYEVPSLTEYVSNGQKMPEKKKEITLIPPRKTGPSHSVFGAIKKSHDSQTPAPANIQVSQPVSTPTNINTADPVYIVMSKSKKVETEIQMTMTVALPAQSIYDMVKESFEEGDKKLVKYIIETITVEEIKNALKDAISTMYEQVPMPENNQ